MKTNKTLFILLFSFGLIVSCKNEPENPENKGTSTEVKQNENKSDSLNSAEGFYVIDNDNSIVSWVGSKPAGQHNGQIKVKSGEMYFSEGQLESAKFTADMTSINVMDLVGDEKMDLENHLKGKIEGKEDHFFNVEKYPESTFVLKSVIYGNDAYKIYGELTIKGQTNPIEFNSNLEFGDKNKSVKLTSEEFEIDRTKWGIEYMSKSVFDDLKERFIDDNIKLKVQLKAKKKS